VIWSTLQYRYVKMILLKIQHLNVSNAELIIIQIETAPTSLSLYRVLSSRHIVLLTMIELILLDEIFCRVVNVMMWFDGSNDRSIARHHSRRISCLSIKRDCDHVERKECHRCEI